MITVGTNNSPLEKVRKIVVEEPLNAGKNWVGIRHRDLLDKFKTCLSGINAKVVDSCYSLSSDNADLVAGFDLKVDWLNFSKRTWPSVVIRNSNSRKRALGMYVGYRIAEVGIPLFYFPLAKRHTNGVDLDSIMVETQFNLRQAIEDLEGVRDSMDTMTLSLMETEHTLMRAGRQEILPWHLIGQADKDIASFDNDHTTSWEALYGMCLAATKWNVPFYQMERLHKFGMMLPEYPVKVAEEVGA